MPSANASWRGWPPEVFLVGGGPSLTGFDFEKLRGRWVVAINGALNRIPWAAAVFSLDGTWIRRSRELLLDYAGEVWLAPPEDVAHEIPRATYLERSRARGLSDAPGVICLGGNSGYGALNLAYLQGARRIVLLGYDFRSGYWHGGYAWHSAMDTRYYRQWAQRFEDTVPQLKARGVEVLNASSISLVAAFPKIDLEAYLCAQPLSCEVTG